MIWRVVIWTGNTSRSCFFYCQMEVEVAASQGPLGSPLEGSGNTQSVIILMVVTQQVERHLIIFCIWISLSQCVCVVGGRGVCTMELVCAPHNMTEGVGGATVLSSCVLTPTAAVCVGTFSSGLAGIGRE